MISRRTLAGYVVAVLLAASVTPAYAASTPAAAKACTSAPAKPTLRAVWSANGGPAFTVSTAAGKSPATSVRWTVSYFDPAALRWGGFSAWRKVPVSRVARTLLRADPSPSKSLVNLVAVAANACGSSAQQRLEVPLRSATQLAARPTLAAAIPLRVGVIPFDVMAGAATSGLPLSVLTSTPTTCVSDPITRRLVLKAAGECRVRISERNGAISLPNPDVELALTLVSDIAPLPVASVDRPDERAGFQIHVVYVTPRGATSHGYDANGQLGLWIALAQDWLQRRLGHTFAFDTFDGRVDVTSLTSRYSVDELAARANSETAGSQALLELLADEFAVANGTGVPGKNLLFVIDGSLSDSYCGFADRPGALALVTPGSRGCWTGDQDFIAQERGLNWMSATIIHELLHNVGVGHVCVDDSDIMIGDSCSQPDARAVITLDAKGTQYVGGTQAGVDIRTVKVWADGSGSRHIAVEGLCYIAEACALPRSWWTSGAQLLDVQELIAGEWRTIATFSARQDAGHSAAYPFTYDATVTPTSAGTHTYRFRLQPAPGWGEYLGEPITVVVPY